MSRISHNTVSTVIDTAEIREVVQRFVNLKNAGTNLTACCPFHEEKSPSFVVSPARNIYKCFGCGKGGNPVKFVMEHERKTFPEAIEFLAEMYGIQVEYDGNFDDEAHKQKLEMKDGIIQVNEFALQKYKAELDHAPDDVKQYIDSRFTKEQLLEYGIGYAPDKHKFITTPMISSGNYTYAVASGVIGERDGQGYDTYRNRIIFPIQDRDGRTIGFGARAMGDAKPKYLNSPENPAYNKSKVLYGFDKAHKAVVQHKYAYLVEGYTDVIAMQSNGYENTVATCGTSLTADHARMLKRYCHHVIIARDGDAAGTKAVRRDMEILLGLGFRTEVVIFPEGEDPDSYLKNDNKLPNAQDAVIWAVADMFNCAEDPFTKSQAVNHMVELLSVIGNELLRNQYLKSLCKTYKLKEVEMRKLFTTKKEESKEDKPLSFNGKLSAADYYVWPEELEAEKAALIDDLRNYNIIIHGRMMYGTYGKEFPLELRPISNYSIEIIQHMAHEKFPKKLMRIENTFGETRIFDVMSDEINTIRGLDNAVTRQGNYLFWGDEKHFQALRKKLFAEMGKGAMIEQLGYQNEGFWVTNSHIINRDGSVIKIDDYGVYKTADASYYIPSANRNYRNNDFKFSPQKKVVLQFSDVSLEEYLSLIYNVHRQHSITGILYTIASVFSDLVYDRLKGFPLEFLHGKPSTGKDNMIMACQAIFGHPQAPLNLGNGASTMKAQIRKFAQFRNMVVNLSEYRRGDKRLNEYLKGLWGRDGYERGNIDSQFGTDTMPILSGVYITGNDYPDDDALISRCIVEEFTKTDFTTDEKAAYKHLTATYNKGVSGLLVDIFKHRETWESKFAEAQEAAEREIKADMRILGANERTFQNFGVIGATYKLMSAAIRFPFTWADVLKHLTSIIEVQVRKQASGGKVSKFWDTFIACVRTKSDPLIHYQDFRLDGDKLMIQMLNCYGRMQNEWFRMNNEPAPAKSDMIELLKTDEAYVKDDPSYRFGEGKNGKRSSAIVFNVTKTGIDGELGELLEFVDSRSKYAEEQYGKLAPAKSESNLFSPATPEGDDLPF